MYRLVLYYLIALVLIANGLSALGFLSYNPINIFFSAVFIVSVCYITNTVFARVYNVPVNIESAYITALILTLIITPYSSINDIGLLWWSSVLSMASKYIFAINKKHIFNPAAIAVVLTALFANQPASWWVGDMYMFPFVLAGGLLLVRKIQREYLVYTFFITTFIVVIGYGILRGTNIVQLGNQLIFHSSLVFFALVMLTEPLTTPPTKNLQILYGGLVGLLFAPQIHIGSMYSTPELALCVGNIFSYIVSPKTKLLLSLKEKIQIAPDIYDFVFELNKKISFTPGQYMEWTLGHDHVDSRGNRRYFTLASSPTEDTLRIGVKYYEQSSSFKKNLIVLDHDPKISASQIAGDFILPKPKKQRLVFVAGGIGVTPYRSMIKYLLDKNEIRNITLIYVDKTKDELVYTDVFEKAEKELGIKIVYSLTDKNHIPNNWNGYVGRINEDVIRKEIPDFMDRIFYLSGPHAMVVSFQETLQNMGVPNNHLKVDFFPGFV